MAFKLALEMVGNKIMGINILKTDKLIQNKRLLRLARNDEQGRQCLVRVNVQPSCHLYVKRRVELS